MRIYDFEYNQKAEYQLEGVSSLTGFSYKANETLVLGGSPTSVETGRQKLIVRDLKSNKQVSVSGLNLFLLHEDSLSLTDDGNLISVNYEGTVSEYTFTLTPLGELFDEFADKEI